MKSKRQKQIALHATDSLAGAGFLRLRLDNNLILFDIYRKSGQDNIAVSYATRILPEKDSLFNENTAMAVSQMETKYKTEQKEKELTLLNKLQKAQYNQIRGQRYFIFLLVGFLVILTILVSLLFRSNGIIRQSRKRIELLMDELDHRTKNNLQIIIDILNLQKNLVNEDKLSHIIESCIYRIHSMAVIHTQLYKKETKGLVDIKLFIESLVANLTSAYENSHTTFDTSLNLQHIYIDMERAIPVGLILNELITNIYKYGVSHKGRALLKISLIEKNSNFEIEITDNCENWNYEESRKSRKGLGLFLVERLVRQLKALWNVFNNNTGTTHYIKIPK